MTKGWHIKVRTFFGSQETKHKGLFLILLLLPFISFGVILSLPFLNYNLPGGSDTPAYFLYARMTQEEGFAYLLQSDRPLTFAFVTILNMAASTLNMSPPAFLLLAQLVLGLLYISAIFFIVFIATENRWIAILSSMFAATSANTLRFQPLMSNFLAFSLTIYSIAFLLSYRKGSSKNHLILGFLFLLLSLFAHPWQTLFFTILLFLSSFLYLITSHDEQGKSKATRLRFAVIAVVLLAIFLSTWFILWPSTFSDLMRRVKQIWDSLFTVSSETFLLSTLNWIILETWVLKLTGLAGILCARTFIRNKFDLIAFYLWFVLPLLGSTLLLFGDDSMRFFIVTPFAIFSSFSIARIAVFIQRSNVRPRIIFKVIKLDKISLSVLLVSAIFAVNFLETYSWQLRYMDPTIEWHDYETLLNVQKYIGNYSIIPIYPVKDAGVWAEAILGSISRRIFVYYGKIENLIRDEEPIINSQLPYSIKFLEENYTVVIIDKLYSPYLPIRQILRELDEEGIFYLQITNYSEYSFVNDFLTKIGNIKVAIVGLEADPATRVVEELGLSYEYLGNGSASLPDTQQLLQYDLMMLANWNISSEDDFLKLQTYSSQRSVMAFSASAYNIFKYNNTFFEETFGARWAGNFNSTRSKMVYFDNSTFFTSHLTTPYIRDLLGCSPVANLTNARGLARINASEYYLLTLNQRGDFRNGVFGRSLYDLDEDETFLLKKLIVSFLNL